jgi:hypothetical protein
MLLGDVDFGFLSLKLASHLALFTVAAGTVTGALDLVLAASRAGVDHSALLGVCGRASHDTCMMPSFFALRWFV